MTCCVRSLYDGSKEATKELVGWELFECTTTFGVAVVVLLSQDIHFGSSLIKIMGL